MIFSSSLMWMISILIVFLESTCICLKKMVSELSKEKKLPTPPPLDITKGDGCHSHSQVAGAYIFIRREYASRIKVR